MPTKLLLDSLPYGLKTSHRGVEMHSSQLPRPEDTLSSSDLETVQGICWGLLGGSLLWLALFSVFWILS